MTNTAKPTRQSNVELLRIVCMIMIMSHHFIVHTMDSFSALPMATRVFNALCYVAVNCYVLISGYFRIKLSWKRLFYYVFFCVFYALAINAANRLVAGGSIGRTLIYESLFVFTHTPSWYESLFVFTHNPSWWFITIYLALMLMSPVLNAGIESLARKKMAWALAAALVVDVYLGWWAKADNGYSLIHFIIMYYIGAFLSKGDVLDDFLPTSRHAKRSLLLLVYAGAMVLWNWLVAVSPTYGRGDGDGYVTYNDPLVILGSTAFFALFLTFDFRSRIVNFAAKSVLAAYLLQEGIRGVYPWFEQHLMHSDPYLNILITLATGTIFVIVAIGIDQLRSAAYQAAMALFSVVKKHKR